MAHRHVPDGAPAAIDVRRSAGTAATAEEVESAMRAEGLAPYTWGNGPRARYAPHEHEAHKVLVCVSGSIVFHTGGGDVTLGPGDRMELPAHLVHAATVGDKGVRCVEAYRP